MIVRLDDGPLAGREYEVSDTGGDRLERTVHELRNDETYVLAVYDRTPDTVRVEWPVETREGVFLREKVATLYRFRELRHVPRSDPRTRRDPEPGEQTALLV